MANSNKHAKECTSKQIESVEIVKNAKGTEDVLTRQLGDINILRKQHHVIKRYKNREETVVLKVQSTDMIYEPNRTK